MTFCPHTLGNNPDGLTCTQPAGHPFGCTYTASWAADRVEREVDGDE